MALMRGVMALMRGVMAARREMTTAWRRMTTAWREMTTLRRRLGALGTGMRLASRLEAASFHGETPLFPRREARFYSPSSSATSLPSLTHPSSLTRPQ